jgi:hypothetical protein
MKRDLDKIRKALKQNRFEPLGPIPDIATLERLSLEELTNLCMARIKAPAPASRADLVEQTRLEALPPEEVRVLYESRVRGIASQNATL